MALNQYPVKQITTHVLDSINQLIAQYREPVQMEVDEKYNPVIDQYGNPNLLGPIGYVAGRVYIFAQYIQREENLKWALFTQTNLTAARGATLDRWGILLNLTRQGLNDTAYLQMLQLQIIQYVTNGSIETIIQVFKILTGGGLIQVQEMFPAKFEVTAIGGNPIVSMTALKNFIQQTKAGGVGFVAKLASSDPFVFAYDKSGDGLFGQDLFTKALTLSAHATYASIPTNALLNTQSPSKWTIRGWFKCKDTNGGNFGLIGRSNLGGSAGDFDLGCFTGGAFQLTWRGFHGGVQLQSSTTLSLNQWYYVMVVGDSSLGSNNIKMYISQAPYTSLPLDCEATNGTVMYVDAWPLNIGTYFDNAHCFEGEMAQWEYCANYARPVPATPPLNFTPDANTTVFLAMNDGNGSTLEDSSVNGLNAGFTGAGYSLTPPLILGGGNLAGAIS